MDYLWKRRKNFKAVLVALLMPVSFGLIRQARANEENVCMSKGCIRAADAIFSVMEPTVKPCDDFFKYACGRWNRFHPIPDDMSRYGTLTIANEHIREQMRVLLDSDAHSQSKAIIMARLYYKSCMNRIELEGLKSSLLLSTLEELGYWPLLHGSKWQEDPFDLTELLWKSRRKYGNEAFFQVYVHADSKNTSRNILYIDQGILGLGYGSRDYYLNETAFAKQLSAYRKYLLDVVSTLATDANETEREKQVDQEIHEMIEFEKTLANITVAQTERRNATRLYNLRKVEDLGVIFPQINWQIYLAKIMPFDLQGLVTNDTEIIVCEIEYLEKLSDLLNATDDRLLANYILLQLVQAWTTRLDVRFEDINQDFQRIMTGRKQKSPRWKDCTRELISNLNMAAGALYVREHFDSRDKQEALEMIANLRESFSEMVEKNDWMDEETKKIAIEKATAMISLIGYPDFVKSDAALDKYYIDLNILRTDTYFEIVRKVVVWSNERRFRQLLKPFDKFEFEASPAIVNAFYSPVKNAIIFPAGILQPPFFNSGFPKAVNYGSIGSIIGHEITHGFDDSGSQYDKNGNLKNWWQPAAFEQFNSRKQCIIDQYSAYSVPDTNMNVNGKLTQGENIADNGGVKEAYMAYRKYIEKLGHEEPKLPGQLNLTNDQIFFLSFAHFWCGRTKKEAAVQQILGGPHSPEMFRVIGVLSNMQEFATAFNCPKNSLLNPEKRCSVW